MASSYVNDLRLNELATGDASGTWGDTTNTNLELIAEAFSYGTEGITTNANTHTTTIADGATDPGRSMYLEYTGTLDSTCTITIAPNTVSKLWIIENGTSGSQSIIIKQGSGATVTIPSGKTKVIYADGAGSGGKMVDAFASLNLQTSGIIETTASIQTALIEFTDGDDAMTIADGGGVTFAQTATFSGDIDLAGAIDVDGTTNLDVVDIDGAVDMASTLAVGGVVTVIDGSTSAPSITNAGDANTGIYFPADDNFGIVVGGSRKLLVNSSGVSVNNGVLNADGGITVDNFTLDGNTLALSSGDFTLDVAGDINLDGDGADFNLKDGGTAMGRLGLENGDLNIANIRQDFDIKFKGMDGNTTVFTALTLDMSEAGAATFNSTLTAKNATFATTDNTDNLTLVSTDADANAGPNLIFYRNSASPANNDLAATIAFVGRNNNSQNVTFAGIDNYILDVADGSEDGELLITTMVAGTKRSRLDFTNTSTIFNEESLDVDFRVESDGNANMLFVDGGNNKVGIGTNDLNAVLNIATTDGNTDDLVNSLMITNHSTGTTTTGFGAEIRFQAERNNGDIQNTGRISSVAEVNSGTTISSGLGFWTSVAGSLAERMRIQTDGKIRITNNVPMWSGSFGGALFLKGNNSTTDRYAQLCIVDSNGAIAQPGLKVNNNGSVTCGGAGNVIITDGDLQVASGHGIDFSATGNSGGSMASELFDDYEEGTFSPTISVEGQGAATQGTSIGNYTKIGNIVHVIFSTGTLSNIPNAASSRAWEFGNLPFTSANNTGKTPITVRASSLAADANFGMTGFLSANSTAGRIEVRTATAQTNSSPAMNGANLQVTITYRT